MLLIDCGLDSPGIPPSADANKTFQGFSYIAPDLIHARQNDPSYASEIERRLRSITGVKFTSFLDEYELKEVIGQGRMSTCHRCIHKQTHVEYAVKIIADAHTNDPSDEIELLFYYRQLTHIVHVRSVSTRRIQSSFDLFRYAMPSIIHPQFILSQN